METIAITEWDKKISPLYDASCFFFIVKPGNKRIRVDIRSLSLFDKAELCFKHGVTVVICGAISSIGTAALKDKGIKVQSWICGPIEKILNEYLNGTDLETRYAMPGCNRKCQYRKRHRGWQNRFQ